MRTENLSKTEKAHMYELMAIFFRHSIPILNFDKTLVKNKVALLDYFCIFALCLQQKNIEQL